MTVPVVIVKRDASKPAIRTIWCVACGWETSPRQSPRSAQWAARTHAAECPKGGTVIVDWSYAVRYRREALRPPHPHPRDEAPVVALPARGTVGDDEREPERGPGGDEVG